VNSERHERKRTVRSQSALAQHERQFYITGFTFLAPMNASQHFIQPSFCLSHADSQRMQESRDAVHQEKLYSNVVQNTPDASVPPVQVMA
jgi:hypothetical protein